ncbi:hypothetical protein H310_09691 [Aphanomyces invadans]|uniref:Uncharacterized protein n=1 Tax=Aphanomyces invadans TaxID=157072 RepID=A0A024TTL1_9STRA|nr:hypothetical protein H310_09691 [Aphanomyces invadans]ETV97354.1 hypothetical protein H310_09691 [Aphanomyces invadans]|eukprot:XP_008874062.1 hypothetical protein H310_09691 [Aphanomyces invadans]
MLVGFKNNLDWYDGLSLADALTPPLLLLGCSQLFTGTSTSGGHPYVEVSGLALREFGKAEVGIGPVSCGRASSAPHVVHTLTQHNEVSATATVLKYGLVQLPRAGKRQGSLICEEAFEPQLSRLPFSTTAKHHGRILPLHLWAVCDALGSSWRPVRDGSGEIDTGKIKAATAVKDFMALMDLRGKVNWQGSLAKLWQVEHFQDACGTRS